MDGVVATYLYASLVAAPVADLPPKAVSSNWCTVGYTVMVPDGREGRVTSTKGDICRIMADGEGYVTLLPHYLVEPVYPQLYAKRAYRR